MSYSIKSILANAQSLLPQFCECLAGTRYEDRGIFFSELLFLWAACAEASPRQLVESGRARGLSTAVLAKLFPASRIISIEYDVDHPDARFAEENLAGVANVALLYGDANVLLPELLLPGDVALVDGPKGVSAVALALHALATGKPDAIFIHDMYRGQPARAALDRLVPGVNYSDNQEFVSLFRHLDDLIWDGKRHSRQDQNYGPKGGQSYGPTLVCVPRVPGTDYASLTAEFASYSRVERWKRSLQRLVRRNP